MRTTVVTVTGLPSEVEINVDLESEGVKDGLGGMFEGEEVDVEEELRLELDEVDCESEVDDSEDVELPAEVLLEEELDELEPGVNVGVGLRGHHQG